MNEWMNKTLTSCVNTGMMLDELQVEFDIFTNFYALDEAYQETYGEKFEHRGRTVTQLVFEL